MKLIGQDQQVIYVAPPKEAGGSTTNVDAVIIEVMSQATPTTPGIARIDLTPRKKEKNGLFAKDKEGGHIPIDPEKEPLGHHTAIAHYSDGKEENTFHFAEPKAAPATAPMKAAPTPA